MSINQLKSLFQGFKENGGIALQGIFSLSIVTFAIYYTFLTIDPNGNFQEPLHYIIGGIFLTLFLLGLSVPYFRRNVNILHLGVGVTFMLLLTYWLHLNDFKRYIVLSYWLSLMFIGGSFQKRSSLIWLLAITTIGYLITIFITPENEHFIKRLWLLWTPIFTLIIYLILNYNYSIQKRLAEKEAVIQEREREIEHLFNGFPAMIVYKNKDNIVLKSNAVHAKTADRPISYFENLDLYKILPHEVANRYHKEDKEVMATGQPIINQIEEMYLPSGKKVWVRSNKLPNYDKDGNVQGIIVVGFDVTSEIEEKQRREQVEQRAQRIFQETPNGMALLNLRGQFIQTNPAFTQLLGYAENELIGQSYTLVTNFDLLNTEHESNEFAQKVVKYHRKDGQSLLVNLKYGKVIRDAEGNAFILSMIEDLSQEEQFKTKLDQYAKALETSNKELEQFAYIASHDLKEPLRMIKSYIQLIKRRYNDRLDDAGREFMAFAVDGVDRMDLLLKDLLGYSRAGRVQLDKSFVSIDELLLRVMMNLRLQINENEADIIIEADIPNLYVNKTYINLLFQNLLSNAIKYRSDQPLKIKVTGELQDNMMLFSVSDNGIGIADKFLEKIFMIFQRLHAHHEYSGTGVGLAICKRIVERHGGKIWAESKEGVGTTIHFTLPYVEEDALVATD